MGDAELRALLLAVGEEAGIPVSAVEPETVAAFLNREDGPDAMLVSGSLVPTPLDPARLRRVGRLAVATGDGGHIDGELPGRRVLMLPASLEEVEGTLRWLAVANGQAESSSSDSSSRLA